MPSSPVPARRQAPEKAPRTRGAPSSAAAFCTPRRIAEKKVKLAPSGKLNTQEGLIHYKRKRDGDDDADEDGGGGGGPSWQRPCLNAE